MKSVDQTLLARAADFRVLLDSGSATAADQQACDAWRRQSDAHEQAWLALDRRLASCTASLRLLASQMPGRGKAGSEARGETRNKAIKDALTLPNRSRRIALLALLGTAGTLATAGAVERWIPLATLTAGYATRTGERRAWRLADGSALTLDARSSADVDLGAAQRGLVLRTGQAIMDVAAGSPFAVGALHCRAELSTPAAGSVMIRLAEDRTLLVAMRGNLDVMPADGKRFVLAQGAGCWLDGSRVTLLSALEAAAETAWQRGRVEILDQPLAVLIDALRNYRPGYIRVSDAAARLRVQGVFSLDDTDSTLHALAETMPLQVRRYGPWLVDIQLSPAHAAGRKSYQT